MARTKLLGGVGGCRRCCHFITCGPQASAVAVALMALLLIVAQLSVCCKGLSYSPRVQGAGMHAALAQIVLYNGRMYACFQDRCMQGTGPATDI